MFTLLPLLTGHGRASHGRILAAAAALGAEGQLRAVVHPEHYELKDANRALDQVARGIPAGKIVVDVTR